MTDAFHAVPKRKQIAKRNLFSYLITRKFKWLNPKNARKNNWILFKMQMVTFFLCKVSRSSTKAQRKGTKYSFKMKCLRCKTYSQQLCKYVFCTSLIQLICNMLRMGNVIQCHMKKNKNILRQKKTQVTLLWNNILVLIDHLIETDITKNDSCFSSLLINSFTNIHNLPNLGYDLFH